MKIGSLLRKLAVSLSVSGLAWATCFTGEVLAFDVEKDADKYTQFGETNIYNDDTTSVEELTQVINCWDTIPDNIKELMFDNDIKIFLIGGSENLKSYDSGISNKEVAVALEDIDLKNDKRSLIPVDIDNGPAYIEKDPYDLKNLKLVKRDGKDYILMHGYYIGPVKDTSKIDWEYFKKEYLESANLFGQTLLDQLLAEAKGEGTEKQSHAFATSYGPSVEYDSDNNMAYCKTVKNGWTEYYSNNTICMPESIIHEVGHHIDWLAVPLSGYYKGTLFGISDSEEWQALYNEYSEELAEVDMLASWNMTISSSECFADAFRLYVEKPIELIKVSEEVYDYIDDVVSMYGGYDTFDYKNYADEYPDLKAVFGYNKDSLWQHWKNLGCKEGRVARFKATADKKQIIVSEQIDEEVEDEY